jgi:hypothetical protein
MRPLYAVVVWVVILAGLWLYTLARDAAHRPSTTAIKILPAPGVYELELTPTFDAVGGRDRFNPLDPPHAALTASLHGRQIVRFEESAPAGLPQRFTWDTSDVPVVIGKNELLVTANAPPRDRSASAGKAESEAQKFCGVRVRLLRDGAAIADQMLWSEMGKSVEGDVDLIVAARPTAQEHAD